MVTQNDEFENEITSDSKSPFISSNKTLPTTSFPILTGHPEIKFPSKSIL